MTDDAGPSGPSVYASNPAAEPDSAFLAGDLGLLVAGNRGRLLDARRTPISVVEVVPDRASFVVRIEAFEDAGAVWELALEEIGRFQFARPARCAGEDEVGALERIRARFDRELTIDCDETTRRSTLRDLDDRRARARRWLDEQAGPPALDVRAHIARREGHPPLWDLLDEFLAERAVADLDTEFTTTFVTNPRSGEVVKGHAIVLAEYGLCPYRGKVPRDPDLFAGERSRERRAEHLLWRLAFTQGLWRRLVPDGVDLYRAAASDGALHPQRPGSFVSATFSREVADAHFRGGPTTRTAALWRQRAPVDRLLMTFLESPAMNRRFREAEAVLVADPANAAF